MKTDQPVSLLAIFLVFFKLGAFSFGGGMTGWVYREVVQQRSWIGETEFLSGLALSQIVPGANVANLTIYVGQRLRGTLGAPGFGILRQHGASVVVVDDSDTIAAMRLLWTRLKLLVEPSSAIALAAVLQQRERVAGKRVGIILSGGNVDLDALPFST